MTIRPFASTTRIEVSRSEVRPCRLPAMPKPPPRVSPEMPTVGHMPPLMVMPRDSNSRCMSTSFVPDCTRASPSETVVRFIGDRSTTMPGLVE